MKKRLLFILCLICLCFAVVACGADNASNPTTEDLSMPTNPMFNLEELTEPFAEKGQFKIYKDTVTDALVLRNLQLKRNATVVLSDPETGLPLTCNRYMTAYADQSSFSMTMEVVHNDTDFFGGIFIVYRIVETDIVLLWTEDEIGYWAILIEMTDPETGLPLTYPRFAELYGCTEMDLQS
jgi:hypothetical protein